MDPLIIEKTGIVPFVIIVIACFFTGLSSSGWRPPFYAIAISTITIIGLSAQSAGLDARFFEDKWVLVAYAALIAKHGMWVSSCMLALGYVIRWLLAFSRYFDRRFRPRRLGPIIDRSHQVNDMHRRFNIRA